MLPAKLIVHDKQNLHGRELLFAQINPSSKTHPLHLAESTGCPMMKYNPIKWRRRKREVFLIKKASTGSVALPGLVVAGD